MTGGFYIPRTDTADAARFIRLGAHWFDPSRVESATYEYAKKTTADGDPVYVISLVMHSGRTIEGHDVKPVDFLRKAGLVQ